MTLNFLDVLQRNDGALPAPRNAEVAPAADMASAGAPSTVAPHWEFAFATGIECSNPTIVDETGRRILRSAARK